MSGIYIPYATIEKGQPIASFHFYPNARSDEAPVEENFDDFFTSNSETSQDAQDDIVDRMMQAQRERATGDPSKCGFGRVIPPDNKDELADELLEEVSEEEIPVSELSNLELQQTVASCGDEIDKFINNNQDLDTARYDSNVHEINIHPVWGNMNNREKEELQARALAEVISKMEIPESDPQYNTVMCERVKEWIVNWSNAKKVEVQENLEKQKQRKAVDEYDI